MAKLNVFGRQKARRLALQALYQWELAKNDLKEIEINFHEDHDMRKVDTEYFHELLHQIPAHADELDENFEEFLDRKKSDLGKVELAILRIASYELAKRPDVPYRVVINEALELAKTFGAEASFKYVNGVLDKTAKKLERNS